MEEDVRNPEFANAKPEDFTAKGAKRFDWHQPLNDSIHKKKTKLHHPKKRKKCRLVKNLTTEKNQNFQHEEPQKYEKRFPVYMISTNFCTN